MSTPVSASTGSSLAVEILGELDRIITEAESSGKPLEVDPSRSRLFELFVTAQGAGYTQEGSDPDLTADGICHSLAEQWGLKSAALESTASQSRLPAEHLSRMRSLWSVMRMWMEWTYAWSRWDEFHQPE